MVRAMHGDDRKLLRAGSYLDWLGPGCRRQPGRPIGSRTGAAKANCYAGTFTKTKTRVPHPGRDRRRFRAQHSESLSSEQIEAIRQRLTWTYPFAAATTEPAKASVSELRRRVLDETDTEVPRTFSRVELGQPRERNRSCPPRR
jgi:hypothetical protein